MAETDGLVLPVGVTEKQFLQQIAALEARLTKLANDAPRKFVAANKQIGDSFLSMSRQSRGAIQNVSYQLQDMIVQIQGGQGAVRALSQNLPQLLGGFGAFGAVLGVVAGLGIPLAATLLSVGDSGEKAEGKIRTFAQALSDAQSAVSALQSASDQAGDIEKIGEKYGAATDAVKKLQVALLEIQSESAAQKIEAAFSTILSPDFAEKIGSGLSVEAGALLGTTSDELKQLQVNAEGLKAALATAVFGPAKGEIEAELKAVNEQIAILTGRSGEGGALAASLDVPAEVIARLRELQTLIPQALSGARESNLADDWRQVADLAAEFRDLAEQAGIAINTGVVAEMTQAEDAARAFVASLEDADTTAGQLEASIDGSRSAAEGVSFAADGITGALAGATSQAHSLASALAGAVSMLARLEAGQARAAKQAAIERRFVGDPVGKAGAMAGLEASSTLDGIDRGPHDVLTSEQRTDFEDRRRALIQQAEATARVTEETSKMEQELAKSARGGGRKSGGGGRKKSSSRKSGGGGRSGSREYTDADILESAQRQIESVQREIEMLGKSRAQVAELETRYKLLDEAKKRGVTITDELSAAIDRQAKSVGELTGQLDAQQIGQQEFENGIESISEAITGAIIDGENLGESFKNILRQMAADIVQSGIQNLLKNLIGGVGGQSGGGILGSIFGGKIPSFEGGGYTWSGGRSGGIDGRGGRLAVLHSNEVVSDLSRPARRGAGGGGHTTFSPSTSIVIQGNADERTLAQIDARLAKRDREFAQKWVQTYKQVSTRTGLMGG